MEIINEIINTNKLNYLINNIDIIDFKDEEEKKKLNNNLKKISASVSLSKDYYESGFYEVVYKKSDCGRYYASYGLQMMNSKLRSFLSSDDYYDIDIVNSGVSILLCILKEKKIDLKQFPVLYNDIWLNRDTTINNIIEKYYEEDELYHDEPIDKHHIKTAIIKILNGGSCDIDSSILKKFKKEMKTIYDKLDFKNGSEFSYMIYKEENLILQSIYDRIKTKYPNNGYVLIFDGIMVSKHDIESNDNIDIEDLIEDINNYAKRNGLSYINFINKKFNTNDTLLKLPSLVREKSYYKLRDNFNKNEMVKISDLGVFQSLNNIDLCIKNVSSLYAKYSELSYYYIDKKGQVKNGDFIQCWNKDNVKGLYTNYKFKPGDNTNDGLYNLFNGFIIEKINNNDKLDFKNSLIYKHIKYMCNNDDVIYDYLINWLSFMFKYPGERQNVSIVIKSREGMGKDLIFYDWLKNIMGDRYILQTESNKAFCKFNGIMKNKILTIISETNIMDTKDKVELIKQYITNATINIENKGYDTIVMDNYSRFMFFTNNDIPLKIDSNDRRFMIINNDDIENKANNRDYFKPLIDEIQSKKYDKAFYDYLMSYDSKNFDFTNRPKGEYTNTIHYNSLSTIDKFLLHYYAKNREIITDKYAPPTSELYNNYIDYITFELNLKPEQGINRENFKLQLNNKGFIKYKSGVDRYKLYKNIFNDYITKNKYEDIINNINEQY